MSDKRIITDTERIDFMEARAQHYEDAYGEGRESAWCSTVYGPPLRCTKDENFRFATLRDSVDSAIIGYDEPTAVETPETITASENLEGEWI